MIQGYPLLTMSTTARAARRAHVATLLFLYFVRRIFHETGAFYVKIIYRIISPPIWFK